MHHQQDIEAFKQNTMPYNTKTSVINIIYFNLVHFMTAELSGYLINNLKFSRRRPQKYLCVAGFCCPDIRLSVLVSDKSTNSQQFLPSGKQN